MTVGGGAAAPIDLGNYAIMSNFARSTQSARVLAFLMRIDSVDAWAVDFKEDEAPNALEIKAFVTQLQAFLNSGGMSTLHVASHKFLELLGGMKSSRCLYLLKMASEQNPQLADQIEKQLGEATPADRLVMVVRRRLEAFTKAQLIGEIFSDARLKRIESIMKGVGNGSR